MAHLPYVELSNETWNETKASVVAVGVFQDTSLTPMASHINEAADGLFSKAIEMGDVKGKEGESKLFYVDGKRVQLLGLGKKEEFDQKLNNLNLLGILTKFFVIILEYRMQICFKLL